MEQRITHACGHEQIHYLCGFASQQNRKARWLQTTKCQICFIADKQAQQAAAAAQDGAAIAHLALSALNGSGRQVAWATMIRANRLAAIIATPTAYDLDDLHACCLTINAKWWIDHRDLTDPDLLKQAAQRAKELSSLDAVSPSAAIAKAP